MLSHHVIGLGVGGLVAGIVILAVWAAIKKPWVPPVPMSLPGSTGIRVDSAGIFGNYFPATREGNGPAIMLLGGSEGGLSPVVTRHAQALQKAGYSTFHFSWWRAPGQPQRIDRIPIESFEAALEWLRSRPGVDPTSIAVCGWSRGCEPAQLLAISHPEIRAVVLGMPANAIWPGLDWNFLRGHPPIAWTIAGKPLPSVPEKGRAKKFMRPWTDEEFGRYMESLETEPEAVIPVERIRAPILVICGDVDRIWPSHRMGRALRDRAKSFGKQDVHLLIYEGTGHMAYGAPVPSDDATFSRQTRIGGGTVEKNKAALVDSFAKTLAFLDEAFRK